MTAPVPVNEFGWRHVREGTHDWYPPREVRLELVRGPEQQMDLSVVRECAASVRQFQYRVRICLTGELDPMLHDSFADVIDVIRGECSWTPIWVETIGMTLTGASDTRRPESVFIHVVNRMAELLEAGVNVIVLKHDPRTEYIFRSVATNAPDLQKYTGVRVCRSYPRAEGRDHLAQEIALIEAPLLTIRQTLRPGDMTRCMQPHTTMAVQWDGRVGQCQEDWPCVVAYMGHVSEGLQNIWFRPWYAAARARAWAGLRDIGPCVGCLRRTDFRSWLRHGALADRNPASEEHARLMRARVVLGDTKFSRVGLENSHENPEPGED